MRKKFKKYMHNRYFYLNSIGVSLEENEYSINHKAPELTTEEIAEIKSKWYGICKDLKIGFSGFKGYKLNYGFNAEYVPFAYFFLWMVRILTPIDVARVFANKGMTYNYFHTIKQPELVVRKINNCILDKKGNVLTSDQMIETIQKYEHNMIVKQSSGSYCGLSIKFIGMNENPEKIKEITDSYKGDFIVQRILKQSAYTAQFNESSLNTFRISTLLLNGKFSICTAMLRFGSPGSIVDNIGAGGGCVGINDDGTFMPYGFHKSGKKITSSNGIQFQGCKIPQFEKVIETARKAHYNIPLCSFVGWDLAIDENGEVNLIEANLEAPGLFFEQLANARPVFRERFAEVMNYIKEHPLPLTPMYDATN